MEKDKEVALFEKKRVRRVWHKKEWWFAIVDVVAILSESIDPPGYLKDIRRRDAEINKGWGQIATPLGIKTTGGEQKINCANTAGILRIIQSIPSPKAEPFKQWLARIGKDRIDEINNPELAMERMRDLYAKKGYTKEWIEKRSRGIAVRQELTTEWKDRGIKNSHEFAILTNEIMQGAFEMKVGEYKNFKGLEKENLRDHMNDLELILTMLAEATTTKLHQERDSQGFSPVRSDAKEGGKIAGNTRKQIEKASGAKISSRKNHLSNQKKVKQIV
jgi:hypothetical protein